MSSRLKKITEYVPASPERTLIQVRIEHQLRDRVNKQREKDRLSWQDLIEACLKRYLEEATS